MNRRKAYEFAFVETFPDEPREAVLYISTEFASAMHLCMCGCNMEVVTPLDPTDWAITFDGRTVSLWPSVGNWSFPCESHYVLKGGRVQWAGRWTQQQIDAGRAADHGRKQAAFGELDESAATPTAPEAAERRLTWWRRAWARSSIS